MSASLLKKYDEIEKIKDRLLQKVKDLSPEKLNHSPAEGQWSPGQILFHVYYSESGTIKVIAKNLAGNKVTLRADITGWIRNVLLIVLLRSPIKFKAPAVASKVPDSISQEELKNLFGKNNTEFRKILDELPKELEDKFIFKHPAGGLFTISQTLNFVREHYLHHEAQLNRLLK